MSNCGVVEEIEEKLHIREVDEEMVHLLKGFQGTWNKPCIVLSEHLPGSLTPTTEEALELPARTIENLLCN